jgi:HSP20 family molecular chaperone IbpA
MKQERKLSLNPINQEQVMNPVASDSVAQGNQETRAAASAARTGASEGRSGAQALSRAQAGPVAAGLRGGASQATTVIPSVDIFEDEAGVTILADMPGVSRERLGVRVEGDSLVIEGAAMSREGADQAQEMDIIYGEVLNPFYRRSFTLSRDLDASKIDAKLNHGVLKLVIPKSEEAKPRRIPVQVA